MAKLAWPGSCVQEAQCAEGEGLSLHTTFVQPLSSGGVGWQIN